MVPGSGSEGGDCVLHACREFSPDRPDNDCCGMPGQTWCAPGHTHSKRKRSKDWSPPTSFYQNCDGMHGGSTCCTIEAPATAATVVTGDIKVTMSDANAYSVIVSFNDPTKAKKVKTALAESLATQLRLAASSVEITGVSKARRLSSHKGRRLADVKLQIDYKITVPAERTAASISTSVAELTGAALVADMSTKLSMATGGQITVKSLDPPAAPTVVTTTTMPTDAAVGATGITTAKPSGISTAEIIGATAGGVILLIFLAFGVYCCLRPKSKYEPYVTPHVAAPAIPVGMTIGQPILLNFPTSAGPTSAGLTCTDCGAAMGDTRFCTWCGAKAPELKPAAPAKKFCADCGARNVGGHKFCTGCGGAL